MTFLEKVKGFFDSSVYAVMVVLLSMIILVITLVLGQKFSISIVAVILLFLTIAEDFPFKWVISPLFLVFFPVFLFFATLTPHSYNKNEDKFFSLTVPNFSLDYESFHFYPLPVDKKLEDYQFSEPIEFTVNFSLPKDCKITNKFLTLQAVIKKDGANNLIKASAEKELFTLGQKRRLSWRLVLEKMVSKDFLPERCYFDREDYLEKEKLLSDLTKYFQQFAVEANFSYVGETEQSNFDFY